eukprot:Em0024g347a
MEVGSGLGHDARRTRPADVLVPKWVLGKPAAFDITVTSPLTSITLHEASVTSGSTAQVAENRKHASNDAKCSELGWVCVPLAVEAYGCWGPEAQTNLSRLAARLAIRSNCCKSQATLALYGRLNLVLVRANARALLSRSMATGCLSMAKVTTFIRQFNAAFSISRELIMVLVIRNSILRSYLPNLSFQCYFENYSLRIRSHNSKPHIVTFSSGGTRITRKVPAPLAPYLAGGNLTALMKLRSLDGMSGQLPWVKSSDVWQLALEEQRRSYTSSDFEILGAPTGSHDFCTAFIERKWKEANQLLSLLRKLCDPESAIALLRRIMVFNGKVACCEQLSVEDVLATSQHPHKLSSAIEKTGYLSVLDGSSTVDKGRLLAISAPQAHAWLRAQSSPKLGNQHFPPLTSDFLIVCANNSHQFLPKLKGLDAGPTTRRSREVIEIRSHRSHWLQKPRSAGWGGDPPMLIGRPRLTSAGWGGDPPVLDGEETHQCWMGRRPTSAGWGGDPPVLDGEETTSAEWGGDPPVLDGEETTSAGWPSVLDGEETHQFWMGRRPPVLVGEETLQC